MCFMKIVLLWAPADYAVIMYYVRIIGTIVNNLVKTCNSVANLGAGFRFRKFSITVIPDCPAGVNVNLIAQWPIAT